MEPVASVPKWRGYFLPRAAGSRNPWPLWVTPLSSSPCLRPRPLPLPLSSLPCSFKSSREQRGPLGLSRGGRPVGDTWLCLLSYLPQLWEVTFFRAPRTGVWRGEEESSSLKDSGSPVAEAGPLAWTNSAAPHPPLGPGLVGSLMGGTLAVAPCLRCLVLGMLACIHSLHPSLLL